MLCVCAKHTTMHGALPVMSSFRAVWMSKFDFRSPTTGQVWSDALVSPGQSSSESGRIWETLQWRVAAEKSTKRQGAVWDDSDQVFKQTNQNWHGQRWTGLSRDTSTAIPFHENVRATLRIKVLCTYKLDVASRKQSFCTVFLASPFPPSIANVLSQNSNNIASLKANKQRTGKTTNLT